MPRRKIYDIKPPKAKRLEQKSAVLVEKKLKRQPKTKEIGEPKTRNPFWWYVGGGTVVILVVLVYLFFALPRATVEIWPKLDVLSFQDTAKAQDSVSSPDDIQSYSFETTKTTSQDFPATGNASNEGFATGQITIYNKHQGPIALRAGTRFISDSGLLFLSTEKTTVPAATASGSKVTPGSITISVKAAEGGKSYNIGPSNFSIPGFKGTTYYFDVYGVSEKAMTGGFSGDVNKVTDGDIQTAKDTLSQKISKDAQDELKKQYEADYVLFDDGFDSKVTFDTQVKAGEVKQNFTVNATVKTVALAIKKSDLDTFVKNNILSKIPNEKSLLDGSLKQEYSLSDVDFKKKSMTINFNISSQVYQSIDKNSLTLSLLGQDANQINQSVNNILGNNVLKVKTQFWPFWVHSSPHSQKTVTINIKFN